MGCFTYQAPCCGNSRARVLAVTVGPNLACILLCYRSAADHYLHIAPDTGGSERIKRGTHGRHGDGEQGRQTDNVGFPLRNGFDELLGRDIGAKVGYFESRSFRSEEHTSELQSPM